MKNVAFGMGLLAAAAFAAPAFAISASEQAEICADALEDQGLAPEADYRVRFVRSRGGSTKTVTVKLIPVSGATVTGQCRIRSGEVTDVAAR